jgi:hypothetical protein
VGSTQFMALDSQFRAQYPGLVPVANPSETDSAQLAINQLYQNFLNYQLGFSKNTADYLTFLNTIHSPGHDSASLASCDSLEQLLSAYKLYRQQTLAPHVLYQTQEGQNFTNLKDLEHNGYIQLPDSIRSKPGSWYNDIQISSAGSSFCWSNGYSVELRMKFLQNLYTGDVFYLNATNFAFVVDRLPNTFTINGKNYPPGIYLVGGGDNYGNNYGYSYSSNGFDVIPLDYNINGLLDWTSLKIKVLPSH